MTDTANVLLVMEWHHRGRQWRRVGKSSVVRKLPMVVEHAVHPKRSGFDFEPVAAARLGPVKRAVGADGQCG